MAGSVRPLGCYVAEVEQGGQKAMIVHRCSSSDCPTNQGG